MNESHYQRLQEARELYSQKSAPYVKILADIQMFKVPQYLYDPVANTLTPVNKDTDFESKVKKILEGIHNECYKDFL